MYLEDYGMCEYNKYVIRIYAFNTDAGSGFQIEEAVIYQRSFATLNKYIKEGRGRFWDFPEIKYYLHDDPEIIVEIMRDNHHRWSALEEIIDFISTYVGDYKNE